MFKKNNPQQFIEISQYVRDLETVTELRNRAMREGSELEVANYEQTLHVMQKVLISLNERLK